VTLRTASPIRRLALARLISVAGTDAAHIGLVALVLGRTGSAEWVAAVLVARIGVAALAAPFAGWLGDRFDRRRVMIGSDLAAAGCFALLALATSPGLILALGAVAAACESPFLPASQAAVPSLAGDAEALAGANASLASWSTVGYLVGSPAGGMLVALFGPPSVFLANAASFVASAALVAGIRARFRASPRRGEAAGRLLAGFRVLRRDAVLRRVTIAYAVLLLGVGPVFVAELPLARSFGTGSLGFGLIVAGWGGGAVLGSRLSRFALRPEAASVPFRGPRWLCPLSPRALHAAGEPTAMMAGFVAMGLGLATGAVSPWFAPVIVGMVIGGIGNAVTSVAEQVLVQRRTVDAVRSRVIAAGDAVGTAAIGVSVAVGGLLVAALGPRPAYLIAALTCAAGAALLVPARAAPAAAEAS
jgi:MFS family permease